MKKNITLSTIALISLLLVGCGGDGGNNPESNTSVPESNTSVPENNTSVPENNTSVPESNTSVPESNTSVPESNTSVPENNTYVPENNTYVSKSGTGYYVDAPVRGLNMFVVNTQVSLMQMENLLLKKENHVLLKLVR